MSNQSLKPKPTSNRTRIVLLVGDVLLLGILILNIFQLFRIKARTEAILSSDILSGNPEQFMALVNASGVSWQIWLISVSSLVITIAFIILLLTPKFRIRNLAIANIIWLGTWLLYIIVSFIIIAVVAMSFLSFT